MLTAGPPGQCVSLVWGRFETESAYHPHLRAPARGSHALLFSFSLNNLRNIIHYYLLFLIDNLIPNK